MSRAGGQTDLRLLPTYSLHYVGGVGNGHVSADYFAIFCDALTRLPQYRSANPPFVALHANGTSGDINNINFRKPGGKQQAYAQMKFVADDVAKKVHDGLAKVTYRDHVTLAARYRELPIAVRKPTAEQLAWAKKTIADGPRVKGKTDLSVIYADRTLAWPSIPKN